MLARKALAGTAGAPKLYVEDVFSTYLYTGTGANQTITNNIDLSTEGGLVWLKSRSNATNNYVYDTETGLNRLITNATNGSFPLTDGLSAFNSNGFSLGNDATAGQVNVSSRTYVSWTFRQAKKFFDVVTYTGNGSAPRDISHNLSSSPGFIIIKRTDSTGDWWCWHRSTPNANANIYLNYTDAADSGANPMISAVSSTNFTLATSQNATMNINGATYVAYLFAHDAGGFGDAGSDNVISCGSFTTNGSGEATVTLNYEPQWLLLKPSSTTGNWLMVDTMRGWNVNASGNIQRLRANLSDAEDLGGQLNPTSTGFKTSQSGALAASTTYIYIAIRRGPMKTPTSGTSVFKPVARTATSATATVTGVGFPPDLVMNMYRNVSGSTEYQFDRLRGPLIYLATGSTAAEGTGTASLTSFDMDGYTLGSDSSGLINLSPYTTINWAFRRAPGFFDVVCYTGTGSARTISHNLGVAPEMMIVKKRNSTGLWVSWASGLDIGDVVYIHLNSAKENAGALSFNNTLPTSSVFSLGTWTHVNNSSDTYVAYLFASLTGVSKVGSYTGNGSSQTINCGFTGGARFVLLKATSTTGDWVVFDSARGIVSGNDPYLELNTTDAEVTNKDAVDTDNTGFVVNETTGPNINTNGVTYLYLAIA